ncbi:Killer cell lectin-like receptor subfamily F member 2 [Platysternon megacephalum]|uniref:Killer cell lectin-like receptor subfamily F member 2 n=1 Tax=Platysternon megacephalum TaxID=55544 RepID=A0A4D9DJ74_9SAUR|nr:Killer cell lectin-like receptor subfamily F member 2 [Platysternon megacephalum]
MVWTLALPMGQLLCRTRDPGKGVTAQTQARALTLQDCLAAVSFTLGAHTPVTHKVHDRSPCCHNSNSNNHSPGCCLEVFQGCSPQTDTDAASLVAESSGVAQRHSPNGSLEDLVSRLKQSLCHSAQSPSADGSGCKLCPRDWLSLRGKCYWFSKESTIWNKSRADCSVKSSRMLVIQDQEEMEFIQNVTQGKYHVWIGLSVTSPGKNWIWVDSSVLDQTLFPESSPTDVNSCGMIKGNQIKSEICSAELKWICQKEAVPL